MSITIASQKGGVTKSTGALAIATLLAQRFRVGFLDADPEAFATTMGLAHTAAASPLDDAPHRIAHPFADGDLLLFAGGESMGFADERSVHRHIVRAAQAGGAQPPGQAACGGHRAVRGRRPL